MKASLILRVLTGLALLSPALAACGGPSSPAPATESAAVPPAQATQGPAAPPPSGGPEGRALQITFTAEPIQIAPGECATLRWEVTGPHFVVMLEGEQVADQGSKEVCPSETTPFLLSVDTGETMEERQVTVQVGTGAPPPEGEPGETPAPAGAATPPAEEPPEGGSPSATVDPAMLPPADALTAVPPWDAAQAQSLAVTVDGARVGAPISPYVYGAFIEHQGRGIYGGIWAEMLQDRKFYYPLDDPKSPWSTSPSGAPFTMDKSHIYVGEHSLSMPIDGTQPGGIVQDGLTLRAGKQYSGYVILAADGNVQAEVSLVWGTGANDRQTVEIGTIGTDYAKFPISFTAGGDTEDGRLEILGSGQGTLYFGPPSLMPADNVQGMRADTLALLEQLNFTVYRWPGGSFVLGYDWRKAIGDRDKRPPVLNVAYWEPVVESNDFGPDEFMAMCAYLNAEAYIAVDAASETNVQMAADEVQYFNGAADTPMGKLRAANGHPQPYNVRFFGVGNEMWFIPLETYYPLQNKVAQAMLEVDPTIQIISVGGMGDEGLPGEPSWAYSMLVHAADYMAFLSEHIYAGTFPELETHTADLEAATGAVAEVYRGYFSEISSLQDKDIRLALDEWNYGWGGREEVYGEAAPRYYFRDALGIACGLHAVFANSDVIGMVNYHAVNTHGQVKTTATDAAIEASGLAWSLYRHHFGTLPLTLDDMPDPLDVAAAWTADKDALTIAIVNPTLQSYTLQVTLQNAHWNGSGQAWYLSAPPWAYNAPGESPQVSIQTLTEVDPSAGLQVPPASVNVYVLPAAP